MNILILNCGSSSLKYQIISLPSEQVITKGLVEKIGESDGDHTSHHEAIMHVLDSLTHGEQKVIDSLDELDAVGHRVVHGGEHFSVPTLIDEEVIEHIEACIPLAPLHNPANLAGIAAISRILPHIPQVAVFDTAFHQSMPEQAFLYALPYDYYKNHQVRRYGFHGPSHDYVSREAAEQLGKARQELKIISCHLGNGCSVAAVDTGKSVDTSMGMTPLEGLIMGTRAGDMDPAVFPFIMEKENLDCKELERALNKQSGLLGISQHSNDVRSLLAAMEEGNTQAKLAIDMFCYRIRKYIGSYMAVMDGADAIVFTGGIGQNSQYIRDTITQPISNMLTAMNTKVMAIETNEELMIARGAAGVIGQ